MCKIQIILNGFSHLIIASYAIEEKINQSGNCFFYIDNKGISHNKYVVRVPFTVLELGKCLKGFCRACANRAYTDKRTTKMLSQMDMMGASKALVTSNTHTHTQPVPFIEKFEKRIESDVMRS